VTTSSSMNWIAISFIYKNQWDWLLQNKYNFRCEVTLLVEFSFLLYLLVFLFIHNRQWHGRDIMPLIFYLHILWLIFSQQQACTSILCPIQDNPLDSLFLLILTLWNIWLFNWMNNLLNLQALK
jgi:hypothetical protein